MATRSVVVGVEVKSGVGLGTTIGVGAGFGDTAAVNPAVVVGETGSTVGDEAGTGEAHAARISSVKIEAVAMRVGFCCFIGSTSISMPVNG
ncbi:MAG: hypothetical protein HY678_02665 [Chloroflexi bacterium]|nr:hypothetical protein [Chloroflexota bacterium]